MVLYDEGAVGRRRHLAVKSFAPSSRTSACFLLFFDFFSSSPRARNENELTSAFGQVVRLASRVVRSAFPVHHSERGQEGRDAPPLPAEPPASPDGHFPNLHNGFIKRMTLKSSPTKSSSFSRCHTRVEKKKISRGEGRRRRTPGTGVSGLSGSKAGESLTAFTLDAMASFAAIASHREAARTSRRKMIERGVLQRYGPRVPCFIYIRRPNAAKVKKKKKVVHALPPKCRRCCRR